ncbi:hypothetical protein BU24DRAFT_467291 [Aaosphaeria arxii CBS 175.79]|uniref:Uncharacterized protein n=1 Tax=Aaosphaeria arxii CBS 175.79 TaxID=1450172 RepID=A0A6A5XCH5_9PLEO|nr:uncharacterized protein BU24DRAFT_467291 [Aaosphaeria arxii CBS 175.79]KAF2010692.1 hypothetical protein BU24DRAFT_467291 [Aaosphaeria arxii CBS 175.79]
MVDLDLPDSVADHAGRGTDDGCDLRLSGALDERRTELASRDFLGNIPEAQRTASQSQKTAVHNEPLEGHRSASSIKASDYDVEHSGYTTETAASTDFLPGSAYSSLRDVHHRKRVREESQFDSSTHEVLRYYSSSPEDDFNEVPAIHRGASREEVFLQTVQYVRDEFPDVPIMDRLVEHVRDSLVRRVSENPQSERLHHSSNSQSPDTSELNDELVYLASDEEEHPIDSPASGDSFSAMMMVLDLRC